MAEVTAAELAYFDQKQPTYLNHKRFFQEFLDREDDDKYRTLCMRLVDSGGTRLLVNLNDLRLYDAENTKKLMKKPMEYFAPFCGALKDFIGSLPEDAGEVRKPTNEEYTIGFEGSFGASCLSPRGLEARHLGQLLQVEGIATRCSMVRPKVGRTVHYCEETNAWTENEYHDALSLTGFPTSSVYPTQDSEGRRLTTEFGLSVYTDTQTLAIQEMPERAPAGLLPRYISVVLAGDLVDSCKPGDRVQITGIFRAVAGGSQGETSGLFQTIIIANNVRQIGHTTSASTITEQDIVNIRSISKRPDVFELLSRSVAPSIFGHDFIKKAIVLLLLGGVEKNLANGTHIRGDINMLLVGDPSTAKSQLLRFVLNIAPLAINTTGRGSSGVGLTAAVLHDKDTGERRLEAGAMVLADRGVVCIDEFDKMSENDRVAIHEVMEQQTVTIAKAGIHMSLNARCSVVAAANPRYGNYDPTSPAHHNVNLPDSLLSRFDLLFIVLDRPDPAIDRKISDKVLKNHRYVSSHDMEDPEEKEEEAETAIFQKFDKHFHTQNSEAVPGGRGRLREAAKSNILSIAFMKKYIEFAKKSYAPVLSEAACQYIGEQYLHLRQTAEQKPLPVTARALETMIRLSCAHAKARLSKTVSKTDAMQALHILNFALDHDTQTLDKEKKQPAEGKASGDDDEEDGDGGEGGEDGPDLGPFSPSSSKASKATKKSKDKKRKKSKGDSQEEEEEEDMSVDGAGLDSKYTPTTPRDSSISVRSRRKRQRTPGASSVDDEEQGISSQSQGLELSQETREEEEEAVTIDPHRLNLFKTIYATIIRGSTMQIDFTDLMDRLNKARGDEAPAFAPNELRAILRQMEVENRLMFRNDSIWRLV
eukprot:gb/GEZN01002026.1/.p1 GENE.gb/GEZN01002026.1/~~gb/GEZN01002026.1/.p1  ORF type:complete len:873 (+),score=204.22 gb/GEZN01002026.1/:19-2637(+)